MAPPTAMSWLRRRGPAVSHSVLQQLFRSRQVRVFDIETGKVNRVKDDKVLGLGDIVLYPKTILYGGKTERQAALSQTKLPPASASPGAHGAVTAKQRQQQQGLKQQAAQDPLVHTSQQQPHTLPTSSNYAPSVSVTQAQQSPSLSSHPAAPSPQPPPAARESFPQPATHHSTAPPQHQPHPPHTSTPRSTPHPADAASAVPPATAEPSIRSQRQKGAGSSPSHRQLGSVPASAAINQTPPSVAKPDRAPAASGVASAVPDRPRVRSWMLGNTSDMVFVNKPAGVASMGPNSLNSMMQQGLRLGPIDEPKLVHRLDKLVSGAMVVARNADSAHWLSACFREKSAQGVEPGAEPQVPPSMHVKRVYWAFVAGHLQPRLTGRIRYPILVDGKYHPAVTQFRVKHTCEGVSWLELVPETGRRHQLRIHCAQCLRTPIIGDVRYGYKGLTPTQGLFRGAAPPPEESESDTGRPGSGSHRGRKSGVDSDSGGYDGDDDGDDDGGLGEGEEMVQMDGFEGGGGGDSGEQGAEARGGSLPIFLHSRRLVVKKPLRHAVVAIAPLPRYIRQLVAGLGWPLPTH
ncbi:MAG: hypothetical protein WDW36_004812 [Sanguina aurantia]